MSAFYRCIKCLYGTLQLLQFAAAYNITPAHSWQQESMSPHSMHFVAQIAQAGRTRRACGALADKWWML
jgi:hypothetical protein